MQEETVDYCIVCNKIERGAAVKLYYGKFIDSRQGSNPSEHFSSYNMLGHIYTHVCDICLNAEKRNRLKSFLIFFAIAIVMSNILVLEKLFSWHFDKSISGGIFAFGIMYFGVCKCIPKLFKYF